MIDGKCNEQMMRKARIKAMVEKANKIKDDKKRNEYFMKLTEKYFQMILK